MDWLASANTKLFLEPIGNAIKNIASGAWNWVVDVLPDVMGYGAILAGATIILGSMVGNGGMIKPLAVYGGGLIVAICILI